METPEAPGDAELIARVRGGDLEAYGELFGRHHHAAVRMARQLVPANDADDLAGDAFAKVLDALRNGGGPDISFRAYLLTTVRRVHVDRIRSGKRVQTTDDIAAYEREPETFDDPSVTGFESGAAAKAFASLPERWQAVLWHTEVEGEKPAAVAPLLGLTANGVSALAYRAREGLRQAYLQQHLADVAGDRCRWTTERLGSYVRGGLTKRENRTVRDHLDDCAQCTAVYLELVEVNSALPALLAPALLGTAGLGYLAAASGVKVGFVGLLATGWRKATENGTRTAVGTGAVVAVVVAAIMAALALTGNDAAPPPAAISPPSQPSRTVPPVVPPVEPPTVEPPPVKPPTAKPPTVRPPTVEPPPVVPTEPAPPTTAPTTTPPTVPTTAPPTAPPTVPSTPPPPEPTTPILDEGLLVISKPAPGGGGPAARVPGSVDPAARAETVAAAPAQTVAAAPVEAVAAPGEQRVLTIEVAKANAKPVVVGIKYGVSLDWPVATAPSGWTCTRAASGKGGTCIAKNPSAPAALPVTFAVPTGGSAVDRTFTVSARTGRLYDDDSETVEAPASTDENLLRISAGKADPDVYFRTLTVVSPAGGAVTLRIRYGASLSWPIGSITPGWKCDSAAQTCTSLTPAKPAPLPARFDVPKDGSAADLTYTVSATAGLVSDTDSETLEPDRYDDSLLRITLPDPADDPNPLLYNRFLDLGEYRGPVELRLSWGGNLLWVSGLGGDWICAPTGLNRGTCTTKHYTEPLNTEWAARLGHHHGNDRSENRLTVTASAGGRHDTDSVQIPPDRKHR